MINFRFLDTIFLTESKIVHLRLPGAQRNVLEKIVAEGPTGIINPSKYFSECNEVGLRPCFSQSYGHGTPSQVCRLFVFYNNSL